MFLWPQAASAQHGLRHRDQHPALAGSQLALDTFQQRLEQSPRFSMLLVRRYSVG